MPTYLATNPYQGINAHWNSFLQNEPGGWRTFHAPYLIYLRDAMNDSLPAGYYARVEKSLQITRSNPEESHSRPSLSIPDVTVFRQRDFSGKAASPATASAPTASIKAFKTLPAVDELDALMLYQVVEEGEDKPIVRLELLSPSNKPPYAHYEQYLIKRKEALESGVRLVEIDYLHETVSPFQMLAEFRDSGVLPDYVQQEANAFPYYLAVTATPEGLTDFYCFHVDDPIPVIPIPLVDEDVFTLAFGEVYNATFEKDRHAQMKIDYSQLPANFESYTAFDRQRIEARQQVIAKAHNPI